jgi:hypothetical protein
VQKSCKIAEAFHSGGDRPPSPIRNAWQQAGKTKKRGEKNKNDHLRIVKRNLLNLKF